MDFEQDSAVPGNSPEKRNLCDIENDFDVVTPTTMRVSQMSDLRSSEISTRSRNKNSERKSQGLVEQI